MATGSSLSAMVGGEIPFLWFPWLLELLMKNKDVAADVFVSECQCSLAPLSVVMRKREREKEQMAGNEVGAWKPHLRSMRWRRDRDLISLTFLSLGSS